MRRVLGLLVFAAATFAQGPLPSPVAGGGGGGGGTGCVPSGASGAVLSDSGTGACVSNATAAGTLTFIATPSSANLRALLTDESGTGAALFANGALGTPVSGVGTNLTGVPIATGISGLGAGVAAFLAASSSANLLAAMTTSTGTGNLVFATSPTFVTPVLGTPASGNASNLTNLPITLTTTGSSGAATWTQGTNTLNIPQYSGGGSANSVFAGSTGCTVTSGASPVFSLADMSVKSPIICNFVPTVNVTGPTITNKSAGAEFMIRITTDGTHTWTWNGIVADGVCPVYAASAQTTIAKLVVDPDGSTVHGIGCITGMAGQLAFGLTGSTPTDTVPASNMLCVMTTTGVDCLDPSAVHHVTAVPVTLAANNYVNAMSAAGVLSGSRPTCATLSDSVSTCNSLNSPAFTGAPTAPTPAATDNGTTLPTTAYVTTAIANAVNAAAGRDLVQAATAAVLPNTPTFTHVDSGVGSFLTSSTNSVLVVDGYTPLLLDRILVKNQATAANNGIYYVSQLGVAAVTPWILLRALDYDQASDINNTIVPVANHGTANALSSWIQTATVATVDTDAINFAAFTPNGANLVSAVSPGVGLCHFAGSTQLCTSSTVSLTADVSGILPQANIAAVATVFNTGTITIPSGNAVIIGCTSTCSIPIPVPIAGYSICVKNNAGVSTVITLSALGSSAMYPKADDSGYGTAGTGTMVSTAAAGNKVCLIGRDSTHYELAAVNASANWTVN